MCIGKSLVAGLAFAYPSFIKDAYVIDKRLRNRITSERMSPAFQLVEFFPGASYAGERPSTFAKIVVACAQSGIRNGKPVTKNPADAITRSAGHRRVRRLVATAALLLAADDRFAAHMLSCAAVRTDADLQPCPASRFLVDPFIWCKPSSDRRAVIRIASSRVAPFKKFVKRLRPAASACIRACVKISFTWAASNFVYRSVMRIVAWPATTLLKTSIGTPAM